ncbi:MAG: ISLre2 family transposase [Butyrivibrio sp.]|nr:ISLre2 family transposase [Butyrivibrio sp.]
MYNSILQFIQNDIKEIEENVREILDGTKDAADLSNDIHERVLKLGSRIVGEIYEQIDEEIFKSLVRKEKYYVEQKDMPRSLVDVMGTVSFKRRGYVPKNGGEYIYLLDMLMGFDDNQKVTLAAAAKILEEAVESSYSKAGKKVNLTDRVSKETVKDIVHGLVVDFPQPELKEKKKLKALHIVADEDHVAAQFWNKKGDLKVSSAGYKINTIIDKIIVLFEDIVDEAPEGSTHHRYRLIGKHTFCGVYNGSDNNYKLWQEVQDYISANYDLDVLERVYITGDGASWIKTGAEVLLNGRFVLDKFHMMKYLNQSVTHLENADDMKECMWECINGADKKGLRKAFRSILEVTDENDNKYTEVKNSYKYFMNNWNGIEIRSSESGGVWKCCAEGQVSHVLSDRLSSRPMGWSVRGCDNISKLRAFTRNDGKIIELLRYQEKYRELEEKRNEQDSLIKDIKRRQSGWDYADKLSSHVEGLEKANMKWLRDFLDQRFA